MKPIFFISAAVISSCSQNAMAKLWFDPSMLSDNKEKIADLTQFDRIGKQLPGIYDVDIFLNGKKISNEKINFASEKNFNYKILGLKDDTGLVACLNNNLLEKIGVKEKYFINNIGDKNCITLGNNFKPGYTKFDFSKMKLDLNIPQIYLIDRIESNINSELVDNGINAALISWQFSGSDNNRNESKNKSQYLNLTSGLNIGAWRLRDNSIWSSYKGNNERKQKWEHLSSYIMRPLIPWKSILTIGANQSDGDVFEPISFNGIKISTDLSMYPDIMKGFAPVIRGIADSNADVFVYQNGNLIYRTTVPAGSFKLNDLYSINNSGDLYVTVKESNGSEKNFVVPFSTLPVLQRKDRVVYSMAAGKIKSFNNNYEELPFVNGTALWGLSDNVTLYGGIQLSNRYKAYATGAGFNAGELGAISLDVTKAESILADNSNHQGESWRLMYSRSMLSTGTTFQFLANKFSTRGFYTLSEAALKSTYSLSNRSSSFLSSEKVLENEFFDYYNFPEPKKNLLQINLSQAIRGIGSAYVTASRQSYWGRSSSTSSLQAGFYSRIGNISYQLSLGYSKYARQDRPDRSLFFSFSLPLGGSKSDISNSNIWNNTTLTYSLNKNNANTLNQVQLNGSMLEGNNLNWGLIEGYDKNGEHSTDTSLDYLGSYGGLSLGYGKNNDFSQLRYGATGSVVISGSGVTLGQQLGTTNVLIAAPGASNIPVENSTGVRTDWRGYTIKNYASNYLENRIALDISKLNNSTSISNPVKYVIPSEGAMVLAKFDVLKGQQAIITLLHDGKKLPFGTIVSVSGTNNTGIVDEDGDVYLSGLNEKDNLIAKWGSTINHSCLANYDLSKIHMTDSILSLNIECK
ncbi:fimbria/pilus outer membrane usher protein [Pantoea ananatis]|uniref:fimbria/pilus outer membrane usher protein n=1 Tax=Pantoea ananas TaxID=553 RepID=UPI003C25BDFD